MWKLSALIVTLALVGCGGATREDAAVDGTLVVAAFYPLAWAAGEIAGGEVPGLDFAQFWHCRSAAIHGDR